MDKIVAGVVELFILGAFLLIASVALGRLLEKIVGAFLFKLFVFWLICLVFYVLFGLGTESPGWAVVGLVFAVIITAIWGYISGKSMGSSKPGQKRGARFLPGLWLGFCFAGWIGHIAGGWVGQLTITIPAMLTFWLSLYFLAHFILPLEKKQSPHKALRCLVTFSAGTNYPYYALDGREKVERVPGNQFKRSEILGPNWWGPGIFLTGPDYAVAVSAGTDFKGVRGPGVAFTYLFESIQDPMELRPQQRPYTVNATTKDGIKVSFTTFGPFQLDPGDNKPKPGEPFPLRASSIFKVYYKAQLIDIEHGKLHGEVVEERQRLRWDKVYAIKGRHVMQDIIAEYTFDELYEPLDLQKDPRRAISAEHRKRLGKELAEYGVKVLGGGISNLFPADKEAAFERRIASWQAQWQRQMLEQLGVAEAEAERIAGETRAEVQREMIEDISRAIAGITTDDKNAMYNTVALRFIESLNQMVAQPGVERQLPSGTAEAMRNITRIIGRED